MRPRRVLLAVVALSAVIGAALFILAQGADMSVLNPQGPIGVEQKKLIIVAVLLMAVVVVPVYALLAVIAWRYRVENGAAYDPSHTNDVRIEAVWWGIPVLIVSILAVITWNSTHTLDPYRPIGQTGEETLVIQAIALDWKWLFIYPEQGIATVNTVQFPVGVPVRFDITADAAMNAFWIPSLGGMIYAMAGMQTQLHLRADTTGSFEGMSSNFSGPGFSGMRFVAQSVPREDFDAWVESVRKTRRSLDATSYPALAAPSEYNPPIFFGVIDPGLYNSIIIKYLDPGMTSSTRRHAM